MLCHFWLFSGRGAWKRGSNCPGAIRREERVGKFKGVLGRVFWRWSRSAGLARPVQPAAGMRRPRRLGYSDRFQALRPTIQRFPAGGGFRRRDATRGIGLAGFHGLKSMATFGKSLRDCRGNGRERCSWAFARKTSADARRAMADRRCGPGWYGARRWRWELSLFVSGLLHPRFPFDGFGRPSGTSARGACGDAPASPPWPPPKSNAPGPLSIFIQALIHFHDRVVSAGNRRTGAALAQSRLWHFVTA